MIQNSNEKYIQMVISYHLKFKAFMALVGVKWSLAKPFNIYKKNIARLMRINGNLRFKLF